MYVTTRVCYFIMCNIMIVPVPFRTYYANKCKLNNNKIEYHVYKCALFILLPNTYYRAFTNHVSSFLKNVLREVYPLIYWKGVHTALHVYDNFTITGYALPCHILWHIMIIYTPCNILRRRTNVQGTT